MSALFDTRHVRRAFSRASTTYASAAKLQAEIEARLLESLDYYAEGRADDARAPKRALDLGCGLGRATRAMHTRWPNAQVVALDLALPMLRQHDDARTRDGGFVRTLARLLPGAPAAPARVCADARALPLADHSVDLLFSNLCVQWVDDLPALLAEWRRVLKPGALLLFSTFGPDTLLELREAFAAADAAAHVSPFAGIAAVGDALMAAGFRDPVLDRESYDTHADDLPALMRHLQALGATHALRRRRATLTGKGRFAAAAAAYEQWREPAGLPVSWDVITAMAWAPQPGAPRREQGMEIASFPATRIPVRKRI